MSFLKIGNLVLNSAQIVAVGLSEPSNEANYQGNYVTITTVELSGEVGHGYAGCGVLSNRVHWFREDSPEAKAIVKYFSHPQNSINLLPGEEEQAFQTYQEHGGQLPFDIWLEKYQLHKRLASKSGDWSDDYLDRVSKLEQELLY